MIEGTALSCARASFALVHVSARGFALSLPAFHDIRGFSHLGSNLCRGGFTACIPPVVIASASAESCLPS
eukprot:1115118-Pyramimonas_sp.AAC.1